MSPSSPFPPSPFRRVSPATLTPVFQRLRVVYQTGNLDSKWQIVAHSPRGARGAGTGNCHPTLLLLVLLLFPRTVRMRQGAGEEAEFLVWAILAPIPPFDGSAFFRHRAQCVFCDQPTQAAAIHSIAMRNKCGKVRMASLHAKFRKDHQGIRNTVRRICCFWSGLSSLSS